MLSKHVYILLGAIAHLAMALTQSSLNLVNSTVSFDGSHAASRASQLDRQLISLSIEFDNILDFIGDVNKPNLFTRRLVQNIIDISGQGPIFRIGGNTQDVSIFCENCNETMLNTFGPAGSPLATEAVNATYNKDLFKVMEENMGPDQKYIFGLNFGKNNYTLAQQVLTGALKYLDQSFMLAYELGNEPNFYPGSRRLQNWTVLDFGAEQEDWYHKLQASTKHSLAFQMGALVGPPYQWGDFMLAQLVKMQVPQTAGGVKYLAGHGYPQNVCNAANAALVRLKDYMNHLQTVSWVAQWQGEVAAAKANGFTYHVGETNSVACHGQDGVSNTMGAALWALDYALSGASMGIDRVFFHNGKGAFYYSFFEPTPVNASVPAHINPTYHSMLFVADLVSGLKSPSIHRLAQFDTYDMAHFAVFDGGHNVKRLVILNTHYFDGTGTRGTKYVDVSSVFGSKVQVDRLTAPSALVKTGVTFRGQTVDGTGKLVGKKTTEDLRSSAVNIADGEAIIISA